MILSRLGPALAVAAYLAMAAPVWSATDETAALLATEVVHLGAVGALIEAGRFDEALNILQPLALAHPGDQDVLFLLGLAATQASQRPDAPEELREALLDLGITSFHTILVDEPGLVRVRLELARAFFLKGEDGLAREHFERVLTADVPEAVAANVNQFLARIRARRRWSMHFGFALQPDNNIGGTSNERIIYIQGLPFVRDENELVTSGVGLSMWTGGEYQLPIEGRPLQFRMGSNLSRKEYKNSEFDEMTLSAHAGPRWLLNPDTELSVLANLRRRWAADQIDSDGWGASAEISRRLSPGVTANAQASVNRSSYRLKKYLDGWSYNLSFGGAWIPVPVLRANASIGYGKENTQSDKWSNASRSIGAGVQVALPRGSRSAATSERSGRAMGTDGGSLSWAEGRGMTGPAPSVPLSSTAA